MFLSEDFNRATSEEGKESLYNRRQQSPCEGMGAGTNRSVAQPSQYVDSHSNRVYLLRPLLKSRDKTENA